jgi:polar amino acid transport system substrate-binding protein
VFLRPIIITLCLLCLLRPADAANPVVLVAEDDWYPYAARQDGKAVGMAVDIVRAAFAAVDVPVELKSMPYARCMQAVKQGVELGCFDTLKDDTTRGAYLFHERPLFTATIGIYARSDFSGTLSAADLTGRRVGLTNGYTYGDAVEKSAAIHKDVAPNDLLTMRKLVAERVEVALVYTRVADWLQTQHPDLRGRVRQVGVLLQDGLYISFSKSHPDAARILPLLDRGLARIRANGTHARIEAEWQRRYPGALASSAAANR